MQIPGCIIITMDVNTADLERKCRWKPAKPQANQIQPGFRNNTETRYTFMLLHAFRYLKHDIG